MTTTTTDSDKTKDETYILTSRIQLREGENSLSEAELLTVLDIIKGKLIKNSMGEHLDSYVDSDGILIVVYEVPEIVGKFLWAAPESLDRALLSEKTRETWGIERTVTYDDFNGLAIRNS